jgi:hypothetical protein
MKPHDQGKDVECIDIGIVIIVNTVCGRDLKPYEAVVREIAEL